MYIPDTPAGNYEKLTPDTVNPSIPTGRSNVKKTIFIVEDQAIRYLDTGETPVNATKFGNPLMVGGIIEYGGNPTNFKFISQVAGAIIHCNYYF